MSSDRLPGQPGKGIDEDVLRAERYSILMSFDDPKDAPVAEIINVDDQRGCNVDGDVDSEDDRMRLTMMIRMLMMIRMRLTMIIR